MPYEKGFQFVAYLESLIGETKMDLWLKEYLNKYAKQSIYYTEMQSSYEAFVWANYASKDATNILAKIDWNVWVKNPGLPPVTLDFKTPEYTAAVTLADDYIKLKGQSSPTNFNQYETWFQSLRSIFV